MRLTVLEFAERYRIKEADASKLLRRAALDGRLEPGKLPWMYAASRKEAAMSRPPAPE